MATGVTYTVKTGDNLATIAKQFYGNERMFAEIMRLNNLTSGMIKSGMVLRMPGQKENNKISISQGLMSGMQQENAWYKAGNTTPWDPTKQTFTPASSTLDTAKLSNVPTSITDREIAQAMGTGTLSSSRYGVPLTRGTGALGEPKNELYWKQSVPTTPVTKKQYNAPGEPKGYGYEQTKRFVDSPFSTTTGGRAGTMQTVFGSQAQAKPYIEPGYQPSAEPKNAAYYSNITPFQRDIVNPLGRALGQVPETWQRLREIDKVMKRNAAAGIVNTVANAAAGIVNYTGQGEQNFPTPQAPVTQAPVTQAPATQAPKPTVVPPTTSPATAFSVFNTDNPSIPANQTAAVKPPKSGVDVSTMATTPEEIALYNKLYDAANGGTPLTVGETNQFAYVFNVTDPTFLSEIYSYTNGIPATNDQSMNSIYQDLMNIGDYGTMPVQQIIGGGGGGQPGGNAGFDYRYGGGITSKGY